MRRLTAACLMSVLLACAPAEQTPEGGSTAAPAIADFAGSWQLTTTLSGVEAPVTSTMMGTAAGTDWVMMLEGREPIPLTVSMKGDSLIAESSEYESILRAGVMVTIRTAGVLHDGMLMGTLNARYRQATGEEVVPGTFTGVRPMAGAADTPAPSTP